MNDVLRNTVDNYNDGNILKGVEDAMIPIISSKFPLPVFSTCSIISFKLFKIDHLYLLSELSTSL